VIVIQKNPDRLLQGRFRHRWSMIPALCWSGHLAFSFV
jgi:hypothetical protein